MSVFDVLKERGFVQQVTHEEELKERLASGPVTFYIGFDPTADSLHVGHFLTLMAMAHMQQAGHRPICLLGGGTGSVGDPSGKTDMRRMMDRSEIDHNIECFKQQMQRFIDFSDDKALMINNADWLLQLNYVQLLREVGVHFSVNRMLAAECYKQRWEKGLTFFELNYMIMQSYDFWELFNRHNCILQLGGDDQWSNILSGADLIRRKESKPAFGLTLTLLTTSDGRKMGKTEKGALWLDAAKTSPYEFYQYWRNVADADVEKCLALLTFLPMEEVRRLGALEGQAINEAKKVLAFEVTKLIHGEEAAANSQQAAEALFGGSGSLDNTPTVEISTKQLGSKLLDLLFDAGIFSSKSEGRRLIAQGGLQLQQEKINDPDRLLLADDFADGFAVVRKGKKNYYRLVLQ